MSPWARGSIVVARLRGTPLRIHWTALIGLALYSRFTWSPAAWLAFLVVIVVHELGHAIVAWRSGAEVDELVVYGLGGECTWSGDVNAEQRAWIAWGGVLGQLAALVAAAILLAVVPSPSPFVHAFLVALTWPNLQLAAINLIPIRPLDGAEAWMLPRLWWRQARERAAHKAERARYVTKRAERRDKLRIDAQVHVEALDDEGPLNDAAQEVIARAQAIAAAAAREEPRGPKPASGKGPAKRR